MKLERILKSDAKITEIIKLSIFFMLNFFVILQKINIVMRINIQLTSLCFSMGRHLK